MVKWNKMRLSFTSLDRIYVVFIFIKVFNLTPKFSEARYIFFHKTCKCKCRLNASVCNNKQRWNKDEYRCECRELIDKDVCDDGFIWNPRVCECRSDKLCDVGEYIDYPNYKCRKRLIDKLVFPWI